MHAWLALALLQSATPAAAPTVIDLTCTKSGSPASTLAFHVDLGKETFSVRLGDGSTQSGTAGSFRDRVVLEVPSGNPGSIPMYFIHLDTGSYTEVRRAGASEMTTIAEGTCTKPAAGAAK